MHQMDVYWFTSKMMNNIFSPSLKRLQNWFRPIPLFLPRGRDYRYIKLSWHTVRVLLMMLSDWWYNEEHMICILISIFTSMWCLSSKTTRVLRRSPRSPLVNLIHSDSKVKKSVFTRSDTAAHVKTLPARHAPTIQKLSFNSSGVGKCFMSWTPAQWKTARVSPVFKKGRSAEPVNYRPVSLTSIPCKIMGHCICTPIRTHLKYRVLLPPYPEKTITFWGKNTPLKH